MPRKTQGLEKSNGITITKLNKMADGGKGNSKGEKELSNRQTDQSPMAY
jgi:hypothetical protein